MASASSSKYFSFITIFLLTCLSTFSSHLCLATTDKELNKDDAGAVVLLRMDKITKALSDAGYNAMSLTLQMALPTLLSSYQLLLDDFTNTATATATAAALTIFCPPDEAFFSLKYPQPPLTLLQYHVSPMKLEKAALLMESPSTGTKIDSLLPRHPLVLTTLPDQSGKASINGVEIKQWDVYNDGVVIVHGINNFFDPAYQTILYPWFEGTYSTNNSTGDDASSMEEEINAGFFVEKALLGIVLAFVFYMFYCLVAGLVTLVCYAMLHAHRGCANLLRQIGGGYALLGSSTSPDIDSVV